MGDTFTIGQAQDTFTVGIGADGFTVAPEVNLFEVGADVTTITVQYGSAGSDVTLPIEISDVTGLQAALDAADASGFLRVAVLVDKPVSVGGTFTAPIPAGLPVLLNAQANPAQDGLYESNGSGGVTGSPTPVKTLANYQARMVVLAQQALTDVMTEPPGTFYDPSNGTADDNLVDVRMVTTPDGLDFYLTPQGIPTQAWLDQSGKSYTPAMNDFGGVNTDLQLTVNHQIVSCNPSTDITLTMPPHLTKPRHCYITVEPTATANVTVVEYPGETEFSHTLGPGERALILPDQALWEVWHFPPVGAEILTTPTVSFLATGGTVPATARLVRCDTTSGSFNVTLADDNPNAVIVRNESGSGTVTVKDSGGGTIAAVAAGEEWQFTYLTGSTWSAWKESPADSGLPATGTNGQLLAVVSGDPAWADVGDLDIQPHSDRLSELATLNTNYTSPLQVGGAWTAGAVPWVTLADSTLGADATSVALSWTGDFVFLELQWIAYSDSTGGASNNVTMQFNSDTGSNYLNASSSATSFTLAAIAASLTNTNRRGRGSCRISNQLAYHNLDSEYSYQASNAATTTNGTLRGAWQSASRINSIQLSLGGSVKFVTGSRFTVIGRA